MPSCAIAIIKMNVAQRIASKYLVTRVYTRCAALRTLALCRAVERSLLQLPRARALL